MYRITSRTNYTIIRPIDEMTNRKIIDLYFNQDKTIREVCKIMGKSSHDIIPVIKEHRLQLAQNYALVNGEQNDNVQCEQDRVIPNVKRYVSFAKKHPLDYVVLYDNTLPYPKHIYR